MAKNGTNGLTNGQKVFLGVVGMLVADSIITNILKLKSQKTYAKTYTDMVNKMADSSSEEEDKK